MITEKIGKFEVKRFDTIEELVVENYNLFNEYALYDSETGHTIQDFIRQDQKIDVLLSQKKPEEAFQARKNQVQTLANILHKNNFPALQWCVLIESIDGKKIEDYSLDTIKKLITELSKEGLTQAKVKQDVDLAKKKSVIN